MSTSAHGLAHPLLIIAYLRWQHSILEEPDFKAPWTALQNAIHLANEVGTPCALKVEMKCASRPRRCRPSVHFDTDVHFVIEQVDTHEVVSNLFPLEAVCKLHVVPWSLRPLHLLSSPFDPGCHADPLASSRLISTPVDDIHEDLAFVQTSVPRVALRSELPEPAWVAQSGQSIEARAVRPHRHQAPLAFDDDGEDFDVDRVPRSPSSTSSSHRVQRVSFSSSRSTGFWAYWLDGLSPYDASGCDASGHSQWPVVGAFGYHCHAPWFTCQCHSIDGSSCWRSWPRWTSMFGTCWHWNSCQLSWCAAKSRWSMARLALAFTFP